MAKISIALLLHLVLLISLFAIHLAESDKTVIATDVATSLESPFPETIDCGGACDARCESSSRPRLRKRACGTCCDRCGCVPPGTSGNFDVCPCYANITTHGGRRKCP